MSAFLEGLTAYGADVTGALDRFVGDEELFQQCFAMFLEDPSFADLGSALKRQDYAAAFDAAHTMKGVAGNLRLTPLFNAICTIVEALRSHDYTDLDAAYQTLLDAKSAVDALQ